MTLPLTLLFALFCGLSAMGADLRLAWDPISEPWVAGYLVRVGTNSPVSKTNCVRTIDCGTNTTLSVDSLAAGGRFYFVAHAYTVDKLENPPSNELIVQMPSTNALKLITIVPQWNAEIATTNWQDVGFFRIKLGL